MRSNCKIFFTPNQNVKQLTIPISIQEIFKVINEWPSWKSPGLDGFPEEFYKKKYFIIMQQDLLHVMNYALQPEESIFSLNNSVTILIPKRNEAIEPKDYRHISLVHVVLRLFSKILSNMVQYFIQSLISSNQSGFLQERLILKKSLYA
jgi:hypothetical protein